MPDSATVAAERAAGDTSAAVARAERLSKSEWLIVASLVAVSAVACLFDLGSRSLWNDEFHSALIAAHHGTSLWSAVSVDGGNMILYYVLLHVCVVALGSGQLALRMPSALAGIAITPVVYLLARRMFGTRTAAVAGAIVAVSPALVVWDQQARGYGLGVLLVSSSLLALMRAMERPTTLRWCVYVLVSVLSVYTIVYAGLFLGAQWLALVCWPQGRRHLRAMAAVVAVVMLAYVPLVIAMLRGTAPDVLASNGLPSLHVTIELFEQFAAVRAPELSPGTVIVSIVAVIGLLCWLAAITELVHRVRVGRGGSDSLWLGVALSWLFVPVVADAFFSLAYRSIFEPAYLLQCVPAGAILIAFVLDSMVPRLMSAVFSAGLVALLVAALVPSYGVAYEEWAQVSRHIGLADRPGDCLTVNTAGLASNLAFYFAGDDLARPRLLLAGETWSDALNPSLSRPSSNAAPAQDAGSCRRVWFVISRESASQYFVVNGELEGFVRAGLSQVTTSNFRSDYGNTIRVLLLSR